MSKNKIKKLGRSLILEIITCGIPALIRLIRKRRAARKARRAKK